MKSLKIAIRQVRGGSGADVWAENLCRELRHTGHECDVDLRSIVYQFFPQAGFLTDRVDFYDIIHANSWNAFAFKSQIPLVVTEHLVVHVPEYDQYRSVFQKMYHRWIYQCERRSLDAADVVVCVSEDTRRNLEKIFENIHAQVIYNGVDTSLFRPGDVERSTWNLPEDKMVLLFAGNLSRRKGADLLPAIMKALGDEFLLVTTSGNRQRSRTGIPHSQDLGFVTMQKLIDAYNLCDIFLLPSRLEGLSLSTLEAMACGKPVVAFNCSSFPELIEDGRGGFLCEKDNVNEIVERIRYLAGEPDLIRRMGMNNRNRVAEKFTIGQMAEQYLDIYHSVS